MSQHTHDHAGCCHAHTGAPFDDSAIVTARDLRLNLAGRPVLIGVDIDIHAREIITLIGPNGSGKTSLVRLILGLMAPDAGEVRRRPGLRIGYVPQRFDIDRAIPMTVERFLSLGTTGGIRQIETALAEVGASHVKHSQISRISGGELQRVLLARALLRNPELLVLDEPVNGVDYAGEAELYTLISRLRDAHGFGVLLVSHDLHVVMAQSDRVVCLNKHVCCSGVPEAVAKHPEYISLFGAEARAFAVYSHDHDHRHDLAGDPSHSGGAGRRA